MKKKNLRTGRARRKSQFPLYLDLIKVNSLGLKWCSNQVQVPSTLPLFFVSCRYFLFVPVKNVWERTAVTSRRREPQHCVWCHFICFFGTLKRIGPIFRVIRLDMAFRAWYLSCFKPCLVSFSMFSCTLNRIGQVPGWYLAEIWTKTPFSVYFTVIFQRAELILTTFRAIRDEAAAELLNM